MVRIAVAALALAHPGMGADGLAWGSAVQGMRLGIGYGSSPAKPELRVLLQNTGAAPLDVSIGNYVGKGTAVDFKFIATLPDGKRLEGFEINSFTPIAGLTLPAIFRIDAGAIHEFRFPLENIICIVRPFDVTFEKLVKRRASVQVTLEADATSAGWTGVPHVWIGKAASGRLGPPEGGISPDRPFQPDAP